MKKKEQVKDKYFGFLFFIFTALLLIAGVVAVQQIRSAQFDKRISSIEDSVTRIEGGVGKLIEAVRKYDLQHKEASDFQRQSDRGIEVGVGNRKEETK